MVSEYPKKKQVRKSKYLTRDQKKKLWAQISRERRAQEGKCQLCPNSGKLDCHHIIGRGQSNLLYLAKCNTMVVCMSCHNRLTEQPFWAVDVYTETFGTDYCNKLSELANITGVKRTYEEAQDQIEWSIDEYYRRYVDNDHEL